MGKVGAFISLQMRLRWGRDAKADKKGQIVTVIIGIITCVVLLLLLKVFLDVLMSNLSAKTASEDTVMLPITLIGIFLTAAGVLMQIRHLIRPFDIAITAKFPLTSFQMFVASAAMVYIELQIYSAVTVIPVMLVFGFSAGLLSGQYIGFLLLTVILAPMMPFALSALLAVPAAYFTALLENHNFIKLCVFIAVLSGFFILYNYVLDFLADYYIYRKIDPATAGIWDRFIGALNSRFNPLILLKGVLLGKNAGACTGIILGAALFVSALALSAAKPVYDRVRVKRLEGGRSVFNKRTKINSDGPFVAIMKKELKAIIRTRTYAYFYLGIAITTPVMVFLCDRLVQKVGEAQLGGGTVNFGVSVIVIMIFMSLINSFSATALSREDKQFYITKIMPVDFRRQLAAKGLLNLLISAGALAISCAIIVSLKFVEPLQAGIIAGCGMLFAAGVIFNGFNFNLAHPDIYGKTNGEPNELNITRTLGIGMLLSALIGLSALAMPFSVKIEFAYAAIFAEALIYSAVNAAVFGAAGFKKYAAIEAR